MKDIFILLGSLSIHSVNLEDNGDYVCIASNVLGRSFSSIRSLIVSGKNFEKATLSSDI